MRPEPSHHHLATSSRTLRALAGGLALCLASTANGQLVHRGVAPAGRVTQTITLVDSWEDGGGSGPFADGTLDVLTRLEVVNEPARRHASHLLLFGPWGQHLYAWEDDVSAPGIPDSRHARTTLRPIDLDEDGAKELLFIERSLTTRLVLDELGVEGTDSGPFFLEASVTLRYLDREAGALVENPLDADATTAPVKELLQAELGGALNAWCQLAAAEADFARERFELARYRYGVVREWAEAQLTPREIAALRPDMPLPGATVDDPAVLWLAATRRIGALPAWYRRR